MLPNRPSLEDAIKSGMYKNVLNKFENEILINEEAKHLGLNVPLKEQMKLIKTTIMHTEIFLDFMRKQTNLAN